MAIERHRIVSAWRPFLVFLIGLLALPGAVMAILARGHYAHAIEPWASDAFRWIFVYPAAVLVPLLLGSRWWGPLVRLRRRVYDQHEIEVGADGILLAETHRGRFVPYREIDRVERTALAVVLHLSSGEAISLHVWSGAADDDDVRRKGLIASIERGRAAHASEASPAERQLGRAGRDLKEWVTFARGAGKASDYRTPELDRDELWRIVESGTAHEESRVAAALALRASVDPSERARLAVVADETVSPRVRIALEAENDVEDDVVVERLEAASRRR